MTILDKREQGALDILDALVTHMSRGLKVFTKLALANGSGRMDPRAMALLEGIASDVGLLRHFAEELREGASVDALVTEIASDTAECEARTMEENPETTEH